MQLESIARDLFKWCCQGQNSCNKVQNACRKTSKGEEGKAGKELHARRRKQQFTRYLSTYSESLLQKGMEQKKGKDDEWTETKQPQKQQQKLQNISIPNDQVGFVDCLTKGIDLDEVSTSQLQKFGYASVNVQTRALSDC